MTAFLAFPSFRFPAMADPAASSTPRVTRPAPSRRRARAASPAADASSAPAASEPGTSALSATGGGNEANKSNEREEGVAAAQGNTRRQGESISRDEPPPAERLDADLLGAMETLNFDPRQGTLAGFELPADALDSLRARAAAQRAAAESAAELMRDSPSPVTEEVSSAAPEQPSTRAPVLPQPAGARIADIAAYLRVDDAGSTNPARSAMAEAPARSQVQPAKRPWTSTPVEMPTSLSSFVSQAVPAPVDFPAVDTARDSGSEAAAASAQTTATAALADTVAELSRALAEERRAAAANRRRTARLLAVMACASVLVLALAVAQFVVLARVARESAAAQQKTEALLRSQQLALAAFLDTASGAAADIRGTADALAGRLAALPSRQGVTQGASLAPASAQVPSAKHSRAARTHKGG